MRVVVIGAGLAGLTVADALRGAEHEVVVLESRDDVGGRVRTVYDDEGKVAYESGPWRIPDTHARVIALCKRLGVTLVPLRTPTVESPPAADVIPGLSIWDVNALRTKSVAEADALDRATGYADETRAASGSMPYMTQAKHFFVATEGFSAIAERLAAGVRVECGVRVVNLRRRAGQYEVDTRTRAGRAVFVDGVRYADAVFVCVPPHICRAWTALERHASPVLRAVEPGALNHVYMRGEGAMHLKVPDDLRSQIVGDQYGRGWVQASYSAGRVAALWHRLRLIGRASALVLELAARHLVGREPVRMHYWPHAYHLWRPIPHFDLADAVERARQPHPYALPDLFLVGEAFSAYQAWMEGAVSTAQAAAAVFLERAPPPPPTPRRPTDLVLDGRLIDGERWAAVHPGGAGAIRNHLRDRDADATFRHIGHSDDAWAVIFGLQRGWSCD